MTVIENTPQAWSARAELATPWEAAGWSRESQPARLDRALWHLDPQPGETILDYGCGPGELAALLPGNVGYVGYDWAPGMVELARRSHPGRCFAHYEAIADPDLVAAVGVFNLADRWSKLRTWAELRRLYDKTKRALCASLYAGTDPQCLSYSLEECERFAASEAFYATVEQWRANDTLILLEKHRSS